MSQSSCLSNKRRPLAGRHLLGGVLALAFSSMAFAGGGGDHAHAPQKGAEMMGEGHGSGAHAHDQWVAPPPSYQRYENASWDDSGAVHRGYEIFEAQCATCHGIDGRGTGPVSDTLEHKPADLTNHFHRGPGSGDAYLFWRVSEGGTVEPFKSQGSAMPAFKSVLSEQERWDVLTYVHQLFHGSFSGPHDEENGMGPQTRH